MTSLRRTLFTVHMWIGLILGLLLAALGLSGSLLVYDEQIANLINPPLRATTAGEPLPLSMIQDMVQETVGHPGQMQIFLPQNPGDAISVRVRGISPMGARPEAGNRQDGRGMNGQGRRHREGRDGRGRALELFIDPVSGEVLGTRTALLPPILTFAHQLHGNFLMGRDGRSLVVGWLGAAMLLLGISGLVLWWPRRGQWKYAFFVRSTAQGVRFHRELHAATGIWIFLIFMAVSFSGVVLAWPRAMGANRPEARAVPTVEVRDGKRLGATEAVIAASAAVPGLAPRSVTIPARPDQAISVNYLSNGAVAATVFVDPYSGKALSVRDPSSNFMAWMRPVHQGSLGPVWKFLVFLCGLVPSLFVVTGLTMWWKKRKRHVPMSMPLAEDLEEEAPA